MENIPDGGFTPYQSELLSKMLADAGDLVMLATTNPEWADRQKELIAFCEDRRGWSQDFRVTKTKE